MQSRLRKNASAFPSRTRTVVSTIPSWTNASSVLPPSLASTWVQVARLSTLELFWMSELTVRTFSACSRQMIIHPSTRLAWFLWKRSHPSHLSTAWSKPQISHCSCFLRSSPLISPAPPAQLQEIAPPRFFSVLPQFASAPLRLISSESKLAPPLLDPASNVLLHALPFLPWAALSTLQLERNRPIAAM